MDSDPDSEKQASLSDHEQTKRKKPGRSSRRRKAKRKAIQAAEERIWSGDYASELEAGTVLVLPTDRHKVWPGVLERRDKNGLTPGDAAALVGQLGYLPGNATGVVARGQQVPSLPVEPNVPIVLKLYPLAIRDVYAGGKSDGRKYKGRRRGGIAPPQDDDVTSGIKEALSTTQESAGKEEPLLEPFPTLFWLTHPILRTLTSKLELGSTDNVRALEKRLQSDPQALESMARAHEAYGQERWEAMTKSDLEVVKARKWEQALDGRRGVAGIVKKDKIKCLHTHLAHYLSGGRGSEDNTVGKWVMESVTKLLEEQKVASAAEEKLVDDDPQRHA